MDDQTKEAASLAKKLSPDKLALVFRLMMILKVMDGFTGIPEEAIKTKQEMDAEMQAGTLTAGKMELYINVLESVLRIR